jgi:hypothetical protein
VKKRTYKELLRLRQFQEKVFFDMIKNRDPDKFTISDIIRLLDIPWKRAYYILNKWTAKKYYNWGTSTFSGWLKVDEFPLNKI